MKELLRKINLLGSLLPGTAHHFAEEYFTGEEIKGDFIETIRVGVDENVMKGQIKLYLKDGHLIVFDFGDLHFIKHRKQQPDQMEPHRMKPSGLLKWVSQIRKGLGKNDNRFSTTRVDERIDAAYRALYELMDIIKEILIQAEQDKPPKKEKAGPWSR